MLLPLLLLILMQLLLLLRLVLVLLSSSSLLLLLVCMLCWLLWWRRWWLCCRCCWWWLMLLLLPLLLLLLLQLALQCMLLFPSLRRLLKGSAEMWTDVQLQRQLQSQATLRLSDFARAVTNTLEGISAASIQALVTPNRAYESASEWDVLQPIPVNVTVRVDGDCGSSFIPQLAPNNRSQWEQAFSSDLQLPSRIMDPPPCFNESSPSELAALEEGSEEAVVVLDGCLTDSLADVMSTTIATSLVVSLSVSAVASTASSVVVSIGSSVASTPALAAGK